MSAQAPARPSGDADDFRGECLRVHHAIARGDEAGLREALADLRGSPLLERALGDPLVWGSPALAHAAEVGATRAAALLLEAGADPAGRDSEGLTPLMKACMIGATSCVALLAPVSDAMAQAPRRDAKGLESALHFLAGGGHAEAIALLANPQTGRLRMGDGLTPLMAAIDPFAATGQMPGRDRSGCVAALLPWSDLWARTDRMKMTPLALAVQAHGGWGGTARWIANAMLAAEPEEPLAGDADRAVWRERHLLDWTMSSSEGDRSAAFHALALGADPLLPVAPSLDFGSSPGRSSKTRAWDEARARQLAPLLEAMAAAIQAQGKHPAHILQAIFRHAALDSIRRRSWKIAEAIAPFCQLSREELAEGVAAWEASRGDAPIDAQLPRWRARWEAAEIAAAAGEAGAALGASPRSVDEPAVPAQALKAAAPAKRL